MRRSTIWSSTPLVRGGEEVVSAGVLASLAAGCVGTRSKGGTAPSAAAAAAAAAAAPPSPAGKKREKRGGGAAPAPETHWLSSSWSARDKGCTPLHAVHVVPNVVPRNVCELIVRESSARRFDTGRHKHFPTVDVPLRKLTHSHRTFSRLLEDAIYPELRKRFRLSANCQLLIVDLFVVRYAKKGRGEMTELDEHRDGSIVSFNIPLNPAREYSGGGTFFPGLGKCFREQRGTLIMHCGKLKHAGRKLYSGVRYLLVGFVNVLDPENIVSESQRLALRSLPRDDDYLRALWVGKPIYRASRRPGNVRPPTPPPEDPTPEASSERRGRAMLRGGNVVALPVVSAPSSVSRGAKVSRPRRSGLFTCLRR
jgi:hypothetical protein